MTDTQRESGAPAPEDSGPRSPGPGERVEYETGGLRLALIIAAGVALGWFWGWWLLVMVLGIGVMIFLHELGHFLTAKWSGMKVTEFFIGFGPRLWSFQRGETEYGIKLLPVGAYVRIIGMNNLDEVDSADEARTYRQQSFPKRLLVVSAGSLAHFAQAFVILVVLLGVVGVPGGSINGPKGNAEGWDVGTVTPDSAAAAAGLRHGDRIVEFQGRPVSQFEDLKDALRSYDVGDTVRLGVLRHGDEQTLSAKLRPRPADVDGAPPGSPFLGVATGLYWPKQAVGVGEAILRTPGETARFVGNSAGVLAGVFSPHGLGDMADNVSNARSDRQAQNSGTATTAESDRQHNRLLSIVGVAQLGSQLGSEENGPAMLLLLFFEMNVFIGLVNMLPLPPLDGGHAAMAIYERARSRRGRRYHADATKLLPLTYAVLMALVVVGVTSIYLDLVNPVKL